MTVRKFLAIAFMCHQLPERSFHIKGWQFPLCARCTGILFGYIVGIIVACITDCSNSLWYLLFIIPMTVDGIIQLKLKIESNNIRRLITGLLGGIGIVYLFINIHIFTVWWVTKFMHYTGLI